MFHKHHDTTLPSQPTQIEPTSIINNPEQSLSNPNNNFSRPKFASLLLSRSDRIRLIGFPQDVNPVVNDAIQQVWLAGVQAQGPSSLAGWEWKLSGRPCTSTS